MVRASLATTVVKMESKTVEERKMTRGQIGQSNAYTRVNNANATDASNPRASASAAPVSRFTTCHIHLNRPSALAFLCRGLNGVRVALAVLQRFSNTIVIDGSPTCALKLLNPECQHGVSENAAMVAMSGIGRLRKSASVRRAQAPHSIITDHRFRRPAVFCGESGSSFHYLSLYDRFAMDCTAVKASPFMQDFPRVPTYSLYGTQWPIARKNCIFLRLSSIGSDVSLARSAPSSLPQLPCSPVFLPWVASTLSFAPSSARPARQHTANKTFSHLHRRSTLRMDQRRTRHVEAASVAFPLIVGRSAKRARGT
ncbi:hypothetical protein VTO73DRAFT_2166 [Trametes versicolor]